MDGGTWSLRRRGDGGLCACVQTWEPDAEAPAWGRFTRRARVCVRGEGREEDESCSLQTVLRKELMQAPPTQHTQGCASALWSLVVAPCPLHHARLSLQSCILLHECTPATQCNPQRGCMWHVGGECEGLKGPLFGPMDLQRYRFASLI